MPDALPATKFKIYTGGLEAIEQDGRKSFRTVASSSITDRQGDQFTLKALESMAATASAGMTIFLNHSYNIPEDVLGTTKSAALKQRGDVWDLDLGIDVLESNERAVKAWEAIKAGTQLGCSVGAIVKDAWREKDGTVTIDQVELLEASIVGIPANPRSWVERAIKSLSENTERDDEGSEPSVVSGQLPINPYAHSITTLASPISEELVQTGTVSAPKIADVEPNRAASPEVASGVRDEVLEQAQPAAQPPAESVDSESHPTATTADLVPPILTGEAAPKESDQEAQSSNPESAKDGADESKKSEEPVKTAATEEFSGEFTSLVGLLKSTTTELVETKRALFERESRVKALELELHNAEFTVRSAIEAVEKLAATPLGTKTSFAYQIRDFREKFAGVYSEDFLKLLTGDTNATD